MEYRYETTATSLSFTTYLIAAHPEVQDRLIAEIDEVIDDQVLKLFEMHFI